MIIICLFWPVLLVNWVIVFIQQPSRHILQTFGQLRILWLCYVIVYFIRSKCFYFVYYGWSAQGLTVLAALPITVVQCC